VMALNLHLDHMLYDIQHKFHDRDIQIQSSIIIQDLSTSHLFRV
jgi:hypothetical protein